MQFGSDMDETVPPRPLWPVPWKRHGRKPPAVIPAHRENLLRQHRKVVLDEFMIIQQIDSAEVETPVALEGRRLQREITLVQDPWKSADQAARQLGSVQFRGPRQRYFPGNYDLGLDGSTGRDGHVVRAKIPP